MYTQCPECSAAFRVTANDLRQAAGKVRCGGCGRAFDALEFLSEEMPDGETGPQAGPKLPELKPDRPGKRRPLTIAPEDSIALLKTLDQLAGSDIRLEDTGIEWRVLDEQVLAALETKDEPATGEPVDESASTSTEAEQRYDDDTPIVESEEATHLATDEAPPDDESPAAIGEAGVDADEAESGDWEDILEEFDDSDDEGQLADEKSDVDSLTDTIVRDSDDDAQSRDEVGDADEEPRGDASGEAHTDAGDNRDDEGTEAEAEAPDEGVGAEDAAEQPDHEGDTGEREPGEPPGDADDVHEEEAAGQLDEADGEDAAGLPDDAGNADEADSGELPDDESDADDAEARGDDRPSSVGDDDDTGDDASVDEQSPDVREEDVEVETIILEGDTVRSALDDEQEDTPVELSTSWAPAEESVPVQRATRARVGLAIVAALLLTVLALQVVHQNRTMLATIPAVHSVIAPAYRAVGMPLLPQWDVRGWRFEATQGNTNADQLIVYSRLGNTADQPLPYPLIGVSLTDRFEETVGGVLLEPAEYLTGEQNPRDPVAPGDTFEAMITLPSPDPAATGYRLRACYRAAHGKLRCAVGDFKQ